MSTRHFTSSLRQINPWLILLSSLSWCCPTVQASSDRRARAKLCGDLCFDTLCSNAVRTQYEPKENVLIDSEQIIFIGTGTNLPFGLKVKAHQDCRRIKKGAVFFKSSPLGGAIFSCLVFSQVCESSWQQGNEMTDVEGEMVSKCNQSSNLCPILGAFITLGISKLLWATWVGMKGVPSSPPLLGPVSLSASRSASPNLSWHPQINRALERRGSISAWGF